MDWKEYERQSGAVAAWIADYHQNIRDLAVRSAVKPGDISRCLTAQAPEEGEDFDAIMADFARIIPKGLTHWLHPRFFAYFCATADASSMLAEQLAAGLNSQGMLWQTAPAATELEFRMVAWLRDLCGLPTSWTGSLHDSASSSTLIAILVARERALVWHGNENGLASTRQLRFYSSPHAHASVAKALGIAGIGRSNLVPIEGDCRGSIDPEILARKIREDRAAGLLPAGIIATVGATATGLSDRLRPLGELARTCDLYFHVDAAWAGSAMICPENRGLIDGLELADSYVFNPHKWLAVNVDCSVLLVKDLAQVERTLAMTADYLHSPQLEDITDLSNVSLHLGRRFRALKLWFVLRSLGARGLRKMIREHISWATDAAAVLNEDGRLELACPPHLALVCFRIADRGTDSNRTDADTVRLLDKINNDGFTYLSPATVDDRPAIRFAVGANSTTRADVLASVARIRKLAAELCS